MAGLHVHVEGALVGGLHSAQLALEVAGEALGGALLVQRGHLHVLLHLVLPHLLHPREGHLQEGGAGGRGEGGGAVKEEEQEVEEEEEEVEEEEEEVEEVV